MSEVITNMKVRFGADTKQFKKGMNDGKKSVQTFKKDAGSALESFANQFGVSLGPLSGVLNKATNATKGLSAGMKGAAASTGIFSKALKIFRLALISTGIGAILVALGSLVSYFTKTQRGADKVSRVFKAVGAITSVLVDRFSALGEGIVKAFDDPQEAIKNLWESIKTNIVNRVTGILSLFKTVGDGMKALWERDWDALKDAATQATEDIIQVTSGLDGEQQKKFAAGIKGVATEIKEEAKAAAILEAANQKLRDKEIALIETQAIRRKEIAAARLLAEDETVAADKRLAAMQRAQALEQKTLNENKALQTERIHIMQEEIALGESTAEEYRELAQQKAALQDIESASLKMQKRLQTEINSLTNEIESETAALIKLRDEQNALVSDPIESKSFSIDLDTSSLETDKLVAGLKTGLAEAQTVIMDFADIFNSTFEGLAVSFGESIGNMLAGTSGFDDFGKILLSSLGGMAVQVGKMAVATGVALLGIKKALMSLNPYVAIAGGVALIALGTAVTASLSSMGGSMGGSSSISSNTGYTDYTPRNSTSTNASASAQAIDINVSGEFVQRGTVMVATIAETTKRNAYNG